MNEYPISKTYKVIGYLFAVIFLIAGVILLCALAYPAPQAGQNAKLIIGLALLPLSYWLYRETRRLSVTVDEQQLTVQHAFSSRSVALADIDGYRIGEKDTFSLIFKDGTRPLQLPKGVMNREELLEWIRGKYEDVDQRARDEETRLLLDDDKFGASREEREDALKKASRTAKWINGAGGCIALWAFFFPRPIGLVMAALLITPLIGVWLTWRSGGLYRLDTSKKSAYPNLVLGMIMPLFGAGLIVLRRYDLYEFPSSAWLLLSAGAVVLTLLAFGALRAVIPADKGRSGTLFCILLTATAYAYCTLNFFNCEYDRSVAHVWPTRVTNKRSTSGKTTSYYLELTPWGKYTANNEVSVDRALYRSVNIQDSVNVYLLKGTLGIPWYIVSPKH